MTTVYDISLRVIKEVADVIEGTATGGSTTTLADTVLLANKPDDYYNNGRLWIKSGTHASKVLPITDFTTGTGVVTFAAIVGAIAAGVRYSIARNGYPWDAVISAIQRALDSTWVTAVDATLVGDGSTLEFTLPSGVYDVKRVETAGTIANTGKYISTHWREMSSGILRFDYGYAPRDDDTIHVYYRDQHAELVDYSTVISNEIDLEWLKYQSAYELLMGFGIPMYGAQAEYRIEERLNKVMQALQRRHPRVEPDIRMHTAGA